VHLGSKALGGAGLVMTEMVCVSEPGRISPGLRRPVHARAGGRRGGGSSTSCTRTTTARIGVQLGHSGRKGSTRLMWEGIDEPLAEGNWEVCGPSPLPYSPASQVPRELTGGRAGRYHRPVHQRRRGRLPGPGSTCSNCTARTATCCPPSCPRSPTAAPTATAGSLAGRLRYPLEVFDAIRAVVAAGPPDDGADLRDRLADGGVDADEAVEIARAFAEHGRGRHRRVHRAGGQRRAPAFGRSYQTPYADRIRNEIGRKYGVAVIAVGAISSYDDVNSIILAGRADFCAWPGPPVRPAMDAARRGRPGLLRAGRRWPDPFAAGSRKPQTGRTDGPRPRLELVRAGPRGTAHARWRPQQDGRA
jgi:anthraniloyl-CoA monooxygenase